MYIIFIHIIWTSLGAFVLPTTVGSVFLDRYVYLSVCVCWPSAGSTVNKCYYQYCNISTY